MKNQITAWYKDLNSARNKEQKTDLENVQTVELMVFGQQLAERMLEGEQERIP